MFPKNKAVYELINKGLMGYIQSPEWKEKLLDYGAANP